MRRTPDVTRIAKPRTEAWLVLDSMGQILNASDATHRLVGYRPGALVGVFLSWITPPSRHALLTQLSRAFDNASRLSLPTVLVRDDGSLLSVVLTTQPSESRRGETLALTIEQDEEPTSKKPPAISQMFPVQRRPGAASQPKRQTSENVRPSPSQPTRISNVPAEYPGRPIRLPAQRVAPPPERRAPVARSEPVPSDQSEKLAACMELLRWLDMQLELHKEPELVRDRALARVVVQEAAALIEHFSASLKPDAQ